MENSYRYRNNPIVKSIFITMLMPTIFMNLTTTIASMADTVIIGQYLDDAALSVVTFAMPVYMVINLLSALFAVGGCIAMGIDSGKGAKSEANKAFSTAIELLGITALILFFGGMFFSRTITGWLGAEEEVFNQVQEYVKIILLGAPFFVFNTALAFFVRNEGRATLSMIGMFGSIIIDIILNFVFVGAMNMGVAGAAYSTVIGSVVGVLIIGSHFLSSKNTLRFRFAFDKMIWRIIKNGASSALQFLYQFLTILIINRLLAKLAGTNGVVVYTVVFNLTTVALSLFEGISQTIQPSISNYYGEKSYGNIMSTMRLAFITILVVCGGVTLLFELVPEIVPMIFGIENQTLKADAALAVRIYSASMIITTVNVVMGYYLQSIEKNLMAAVIVSLRSFVIFMGATLILGSSFGINGIWGAYIVTELICFVIIFIMLLLKKRKMAISGKAVNILLLEERVKDGVETYVFNSKENDYEDFCQVVSNQCGKAAVTEYLGLLGRCIDGNSKRYIGVEINKENSQIIIRDNLNHSEIKDEISSVTDRETVEYGPVLGWNRIFFGRGNAL